MQLVPVPPASINEAWPVLEPFALRMAGRYPDDWPAHEIRRQAGSGTLKLWLMMDGSEPMGLIGTIIKDKPSGKRVLTIELAAGAGAPYARELIETLEADARAQDCDAVRIPARWGWQRFLPGYEPTDRHVVLTKELR